MGYKMKKDKIQGYIFLKYHTFISAEAFHNGKSLLFCALPAIGSSHYVFLYSQILKDYTHKKINEYDESVIPTKDDDGTVLDALNSKLKQYLIDYDYVVFESTSRNTLEDLTELYFTHNYELKDLILRGNEMIEHKLYAKKTSIFAKIYTNVYAPLEWRDPTLYSEDYMAL